MSIFRRNILSDINGGNIPSIYKELKAVSVTDAKSYIDTGIVLSIKQTHKFAFSPISNNGAAFYGYANSKDTGFRFFSNSGSFYFYNYTSKLQGFSSFAYGTYYDIVLSNGSVTVDKKTYSSTAQTTEFNTDGRTIQLFNDATYKGGNSAIGKVEISADGVILAKLVPCQRISDGVIGFYDLIERTFLTGSGEYNAIEL